MFFLQVMSEGLRCWQTLDSAFDIFQSRLRMALYHEEVHVQMFVTNDLMQHILFYLYMNTIPYSVFF